jgi:SAM-dependent methyltransferase
MYEPKRYWGKLLEDDVDARTVGYANLPVSFNRVAHETGRRAVRRALAALHAAPAGARVLDVGSGAGLWIEFWRRLGVRDLVGIELTERATERLRERFPGVRFEQADASATLPEDLGTFDLISAMNVLLHVTADDAFDNAVRNLAALLAPHGRLLLLEPIVVHGWFGPPPGPAATSHARTLSVWKETLERHGLRVAYIAPATCLLASAVDTRRPVTLRALWFYWNALSKLVQHRERLAFTIARLLYLVDGVAVAVARTGPSGKLLVAEPLGDG